MNYYLHESSYVDKGAIIGDGSKIWHFSHIMSTAQIGKNCVLGQNVFVGNNVRIGNNVKIQNNVSLYDGVIIEDDVFLGPSMVFTNVINPRSFIERKTEFLTTRIGKGASIGANATIVCGNNVGAYAFVAAGATVINNVQSYAMVAGVPAQFKSWICQCGERLKTTDNDSKCNECGRNYSLKNEQLTEDNQQ